MLLVGAESVEPPAAPSAAPSAAPAQKPLAQPRPKAVKAPKVKVGISVFFDKGHAKKMLAGKRVGLITNHTAINEKMESTIDLVKANAKDYKLVAFFAPEHGINGLGYAAEKIANARDKDGQPIYSLHGETRRPTETMLKGIDILLYDIQDVGSRSYTYISTLFYVMEEAAKRKIPVVVMDRPNPINGTVVDGLLLEPQWRSFVGYVNVTYCHGMTVGELAQFFNTEYQVGCDLRVIPMEGWKRAMTFKDTGLSWVPTSPQIPDADTPLYYPMTGLLGELQIVSIGVGYTLPFKIVGAPWMSAESLAKRLNDQKYPGVYFQPYHFCPFFGRYKGEPCQGVRIVVTDSSLYLPVSTQYLILGVLKLMYPQQFIKALDGVKDRQLMLAKVNGTDNVYQMLLNEPYISWKLRSMCAKARTLFNPIRAKYLNPAYK